MRLHYGPFHYYDLTQFRPGLSRSYANNNSPSNKLGFQSCISYRITDDIHVIFRNHIINHWVNEQFAVLLCWNIYTHMHGLIFGTSIWLLAGSTRFSRCNKAHMNTSSILYNVAVVAWPQGNSKRHIKTMHVFIMRTSIRKCTLVWHPSYRCHLSCVQSMLTTVSLSKHVNSIDMFCSSTVSTYSSLQWQGS